MEAPITSAQAMSHPTVVETINALGAIADEQRGHVERLREFLAIWISDGSLQTFEHREKFRAEARALLPDNAKVKGDQT